LGIINGEAMDISWVAVKVSENTVIGDNVDEGIGVNVSVKVGAKVSITIMREN